MTLRMPKPVYDELLELVRPYITKRNTNFRAALPADQRLALTLRFLAFGMICVFNTVKSLLEIASIFTNGHNQNFIIIYNPFWKVFLEVFTCLA